jgi:CDGSH-type Zn-finger protein/truncated hemoglobin YjbI
MKKKEKEESDMTETTPGPPFDRSPDKPVTTREELISLLARAAELEHGFACASLFAAYSLKNDASEGGLNEVQAEMVRGWRRRLASAAVDRMGHLAQISNLLSAIGGAPHITRSTFPMPTSADASGVGLTLEPFSQLTIERLAAYEQSDTAIVAAEHRSTVDASHTPSLDSQDSLGNGGRLEPFPIDYTTFKDVYDTIATGFRSIPKEELFIGPPEAQANPRLLNLGDQLVVVVDQVSACAAIDRMVGTGEGAAPSNADAGSSVFDTIRTEYAAAVADAQQTGLPFEPVRSVGSNPRTQPSEETAGSTRLVDPLTVAVADLFNGAYDTMLLMLRRFFAHTEETDTDLERLAQACLRLMNSVIRPLGEALTKMSAGSASLPGRCAGPPFGDSGDVPELLHQASAWAWIDERLWQLTKAATTLRVTPGLPTEIQEATAALQDLTCQFAPADGPHGVEARVATLKQMQAGLDCAIQASVNGPYLVTNAETLVTWLGERIPARPQMALCRCGHSAIKPFCDGSHARIDFTGQKDPKRVPDRRDTYVGTAITVLDNRGLCAHSGFCTDRLASAFHVGQDTFVTPNGARMDEIMRAVRSCPSGALSYALNGVEIRDGVDQVRPPIIEVSKDGPYRISGSIPLKDGQGNDEPRNAGASREHYSLCRCGHSQNKPFCSGMHFYVNFHDPEVAVDHEPTLFEWAGGLPALTRMTHIFYDKYVPQDPLLQPLFARMASDHPERVAAWLGEVFGGPKSYSEVFGGYSRMLSQHIGKGLTEERRARWTSLLYQAANEAGLPNDPEFRSAFTSYIEWGSRLAVENSQTNSRPPEHMPMPRWDWGTAGPPGSRISALAPSTEQEEEVALPATHEPVRFTQHIKPLFRPMDRQSMKWAFDLWLYKDVREHADGILQRLRNGSMPCDGAWSHEKVEVFQRWVESGMQE